jgi:uncharacterized protein (TIGR03435 family)
MQTRITRVSRERWSFILVLTTGLFSTSLVRGQITGGPGWLDADGYDIEAKADHSYRLDDLQVMFQNLLADWFQLKVHKEVKEGPVYVLTVDKSGSKRKLNQGPVDDRIRSPLRRWTKDYASVWEGVSMAYFGR